MDEQLKGDAPYALVDELGFVVGFARLNASAKDPRGASWALISALVIDPAARNTGLGSLFIRLLEDQAKQLGYRYSCVWVDPGMCRWYERLDYLECEPQTLARPVLQNKPTLLLEKLIQTRTQREGDVCMRKRLAERGSKTASLQADFAQAVADELDLLGGSQPWTDLRMLAVPWERQVGPSCGLAALRMVASSSLVRANLDAMDGLLDSARELGASTDGEMFDISDLATLASTTLGLKCSVVPFVPEPVDPTKLVVITYDKGPGAGRPELRGGRSAHYGVIVASALLGSDLVLVVQNGASRRVVADTANKWTASNAQLLQRSSGMGPIRLAGLALVVECNKA